MLHVREERARVSTDEKKNRTEHNFFFFFLDFLMRNDGSVTLNEAKSFEKNFFFGGQVRIYSQNSQKGGGIFVHPPRLPVQQTPLSSKVQRKLIIQGLPTPCRVSTGGRPWHLSHTRIYSPFTSPPAALSHHFPSPSWNLTSCGKKSISLEPPKGPPPQVVLKQAGEFLE